MSVWDFFVWFFWIYILVSCLSLLISIYVDVFRDSTLSGLAKFAWVIFLIVVPFLAAFVYLIARGKSMAARGAERQQAARSGQDEYIRSVAGTSAASEIESAKKLLDSGAITEAEYASLKAKVLA